jgi:hypothetical protein
MQQVYEWGSQVRDSAIVKHHLDYTTAKDIHYNNIIIQTNKKLLTTVLFQGER